MKTTKTTTILNCLMLSIPLNALAHPGHDSAAAGLSAAGALGLVLLAGAGLLFAATRLRRLRKTADSDD